MLTQHCFLWALVAVTVTACGPERLVRVGAENSAECETDEDCDEGQVCVFGECVDIDSFMCGDGITPLINVLPMNVDFGDVPLGQSATSTVEVRNVGECLLTLANVGLEDGTSSGFGCSPCSFTSYPQRIAPERSFFVDVNYAPFAFGEAFGGLLLRTDDPTAGNDGLVRIDLHASYSGVPVLVVDPSEINFGYVGYDPVTGGETRTETVRISNQGTGNAVLTVQFIYLSPPGTDFSVPTDIGAISPANTIALPPYDPSNANTYIDVDVTFSPTRNAHHESNLTVNAYPGDDAAQALNVPARVLASSLGPPNIVVNPSEVHFRMPDNEPLNVGYMGFQQVSIANTGQSDLSVELGVDDASGDFAFSPPYVAPIAPGSSAIVSVFFNPSGPSDLAHPEDPITSIDAFLRVVSNDADQILTTVNLHGWAKGGLADDVLKVEMTFENDDNSWSGNDFRNVDLELESPLGLSCRKPDPVYTSNGNGEWVVVDYNDYCEDWTTTGVEGTVNWFPGGAYEEPERIVLYGLGQDLADGQVFQVRALYVEDCANIPSGLLADLMGIGTSALLAILGGEVGVPISVPPDQISDLITNNCWARESSLVTVKIFINGTEIAAPQVRLNSKGDSNVVARLKRNDGQFEVMP